MNERLRLSAVDYLLLRSLRGYQPHDHPWLIRDYLDYLGQEALSRITVTNALAWACIPAGASAQWRNRRLAVIRLFAAHLHAYDPDLAELIPAGLLPARTLLPAPHLYSCDQVTALIGYARTLTPVMRGLSCVSVRVALSGFDQTTLVGSS